MSLALTVIAPHPLVPALAPKDVLTLRLSPTGGILVESPGSPTLLARIAQAVKDGAIVCDNPTDWDAIEQMVAAGRDRLRAKAGSILSQIDGARLAG